MLNDCSIRYVRSSLRCLLSLSCCMSRPSTFLSIKAFNMTLNLLNVSFKEVRVKLLNSHYKKKQLWRGLGFSYDKIRTYKNNCILFRKSMLTDEIFQFVGRMDGCLTQKARNRSHVRFYDIVHWNHDFIGYLWWSRQPWKWDGTTKVDHLIQRCQGIQLNLKSRRRLIKIMTSSHESQVMYT